MKNICHISTLVLFFATPCFAGSIELSTYYPAPFGGYKQLLLKPYESGLPAECTIGSLATNEEGNLKFCHDDGTGTGEWVSSGVWTQSGNYLYPSDFANPNLKIGLGLNDPEFKLHIVNDGGIYATGINGSGLTLPAAEAGNNSRFIWYPRKSSFRAGYVNGAQWDDANIGSYSVAFGANNTVSNSYSAVLGGSSNTVSGSKSTIGGGDTNSITDDFSFIGGGQNHSIDGQYSAVGGGLNNDITSDYSFIGGGLDNNATGNYATIGGGYSNQVSATYSTIGGGDDNSISSDHSFIGGGSGNTISSRYGGILGGADNTVSADYGTIIGGEANVVAAQYGLAGGKNMQLSNSATNTFVWGYSDSPVNITASNAFLIFPERNGVKFGMGTKDPQTMMHLVSNTDSVIRLDADNDDNGSGKSRVEFYNAGGSTDAYIGLKEGASQFRIAQEDLDTSSKIEFLTQNNVRMTVDAYGNVGIGDQTPSSRLSLNIDGGEAGLAVLWDNGSGGTAKVGETWIPDAAGEVYLTGSISSSYSGTGDITLRSYASTSGTYTNRMVIKGNNGNVGFGVDNPVHPIQLAGGAYSDGATWINASSRALKKDILELSSADAMNTIEHLTPVTFKYKDADNDLKVGFIAEDVPELVATKERNGLSAMDIAAVLTKVIKEQQLQINSLKEQIINLKSSYK